MSRLTLLTFLALVASTCRGQDTNPVEIHRDLTYASPGNVPQKLDLYVPTGLAVPPPIVIYIHGGGWEAGSKDIPMMLPLTRLGLALASIDYRLSQVAHWPAQIHDCKAAVRWVRAHA